MPTVNASTTGPLTDGTVWPRMRNLSSPMNAPAPCLKGRARQALQPSTEAFTMMASLTWVCPKGSTQGH
jgi:hypothetical protein